MYITKVMFDSNHRAICACGKPFSRCLIKSGSDHFTSLYFPSLPDRCKLQTFCVCQALFCYTQSDANILQIVPICHHKYVFRYEICLTLLQYIGPSMNLLTCSQCRQQVQYFTLLIVKINILLLLLHYRQTSVTYLTLNSFYLYQYVYYKMYTLVAVSTL